MSKKSKEKRDKKRKQIIKTRNITRAERIKRAKKIESSKKAIEQAWPEIQRQINERKIEEIKYKARYGNVREQITTDFQGYKFVAVGNRLHYGKSWRTFPDFLLDYIRNKLTSEWGNAEIAKPDEEKHQIIKLYQELCNWQQTQKKDDDGIFRLTRTGVSAAYLQLAYDLYALDHHSKLQQEVISRLKNKNGYQGARYELLVAATFIRAGFDIEYEDETDRSNKPPEFIATPKISGQKIAVEAKSRHREGVLDFPGTQKDDSEVKVGINRILNSALQKNPNLPYIICIDLNIPPIEGDVFESDAIKDVAKTINTKEGKLSEPDGFPATMYIFTNYPHHYVDADQPDPKKTWISTLVKKPRYPFATMKIVDELSRSLSQYGNIPNEFE